MDNLSNCELGITSSVIQEKFISRLKKWSFDFVIENQFLFKRESDILSVKDRLIYEYEVKICESDFERDIKKNRHTDGDKPNYFYYIITDEAFLKEPHLYYAGVYLHYFSKDHFSYFKLIREPVKLHDEEVSFSQLYLMLTKLFNCNRIKRQGE